MVKAHAALATIRARNNAMENLENIFDLLFNFKGYANGKGSAVLLKARTDGGAIVDEDLKVDLAEEDLNSQKNFLAG